MAAEKGKGSLATLSPLFPATKVFSSSSSYPLYSSNQSTSDQEQHATPHQHARVTFPAINGAKKQVCMLLYFRIFFSLGKRCV